MQSGDYKKVFVILLLLIVTLAIMHPNFAKMKNFWNNNKEFRVFAWTIFNATVAFIGTQLI